MLILITIVKRETKLIATMISYQDKIMPETIITRGGAESTHDAKTGDDAHTHSSFFELVQKINSKKSSTC
jgi:hypothetical protein